MLPSRLLFAAGLFLALPACSSGGSSSSGTGAHGTTSTTTVTGAGGATTTTSSTSSTSTKAGTGGGPADAGDLDAADASDGLGKGGLPLGAHCGESFMPDGGGPVGDAGPPKCGSGLACCYPCKEMMCDEQCVIACPKNQPGCVNGCIPQI